MRKGQIGKRILKTKWAVLFIVAASLIFFGRVIDNKSLTKSAIVIGLGIDYEEELYVVSAQSVIINSGSGGGQSTQSYTVYTEKGKTPTEALNKISQRMGLIVSLSHTNVVVLSTNALKQNHKQLFQALIGPFSMPYQAMLVACEGKPSEVLSARIATTTAASFFIVSALSQNLGTDGMSVITIKEFFARDASRSGGVALPLVEIEELPDQPLLPETEGEKNVQFKLTRGLAVGGAKSFVLDEDLTLATALYTLKNVKGMLSAELPTGERVEFRVIEKETEKKGEGMAVNGEIKMKLSFLDAQKFDTESIIRSTDELVKEASKLLERQIAAALERCAEVAKAEGVDFLGLQDTLYQSEGRFLPENCLDEVEFKAKVEIEVAEYS